MNRLGAQRATTTRWMAVGAGLGVAAVALAACGSSSSGGTPVSSGGQPTSSTSSGGSADPATKLSIANVSGLGNVVVDGRGRTVYVLTKPGMKNVPCTDGSGCTNLWPDLSLPDGVSKAKAGTGVSASLLGSKHANGEIYPTYNGWLVYEYAGDSGPGQGRGEGISSFGGTWYALDAAGNVVKPGASSSGSSGSSGGSGGYGY